MAALIDTGFLLAILNANDNLHQACVEALENEPEPILPDVVLPELAYMVLRELGYSALTTFLNALADGELGISHITSEDISRTSELLAKYADNRIDFVDCAVAAFAERLAIQKILTVDQRHFRVFRPKHCDAFIVSP
jgi:uncharacterized protein